MTPKRISQIAILLVLSWSTARGANLILARGLDYSAFDPVTGFETSLATGSFLDTVFSGRFVVNAGVAYRGGLIGSQSALVATDLATGATQDFLLAGVSPPEFGGFDAIPEPSAALLFSCGMLLSIMRRDREYAETEQDADAKRD